jgi:hypothetical protein
VAAVVRLGRHVTYGTPKRLIEQGQSYRMEIPGVDSTIGQRLKWLRENVLGIRTLTGMAAWLDGLPQEDQPASKSNVTVMRYEDGDRTVPSDYIVGVARGAKVSALWILTGEGSPYETPWEAVRILEQVRGLVAPPTPASSDLEDQIRVARSVRTDQSGGGRRSGPAQTPLDENSGGG